jgi:hypothetical protein
MVAAYRAGKLRSQTPQEITTPWPDHGLPDHAEVVESCAWWNSPLAATSWAKPGFANFKVFISGVTPRSLAPSVAVADAGRQLGLVLAGEQPAFGTDDLLALRRTKGWQGQGGWVRGPSDEHP